MSGCCISGNTLAVSPGQTLTVVARSSPEFGRIEEIVVYGFTAGTRAKEALVYRRTFRSATYRAEHRFDFHPAGSKGYLRMEASCLLPDGTRTHAVTSACFWEKKW
jgi:hypothetical protein